MLPEAILDFVYTFARAAMSPAIRNSWTLHWLTPHHSGWASMGYSSLQWPPSISFCHGCFDGALPLENLYDQGSTSEVNLQPKQDDGMQSTAASNILRICYPPATAGCITPCALPVHARSVNYSLSRNIKNNRVRPVGLCTSPLNTCIHAREQGAAC